MMMMMMMIVMIMLVLKIVKKNREKKQEHFFIVRRRRHSKLESNLETTIDTQEGHVLLSVSLNDAILVQPNPPSIPMKLSGTS